MQHLSNSQPKKHNDPPSPAHMLHSTTKIQSKVNKIRKRHSGIDGNHSMSSEEDTGGCDDSGSIINEVEDDNNINYE